MKTCRRKQLCRVTLQRHPRHYPITTCKLCGEPYGSDRRRYEPGHGAESTRDRAVAQMVSAIKQRRLPRPNTMRCRDCPARALVYVHRNYMAPLDVEPVCAACKARRPAATNFYRIVWLSSGHFLLYPPPKSWLPKPVVTARSRWGHGSITISTK